MSEPAAMFTNDQLVYRHRMEYVAHHVDVGGPSRLPAELQRQLSDPSIPISQIVLMWGENFLDLVEET